MESFSCRRVFSDSCENKKVSSPPFFKRRNTKSSDCWWILICFTLIINCVRMRWRSTWRAAVYTFNQQTLLMFSGVFFTATEEVIGHVFIYSVVGLVNRTTQKVDKDVVASDWCSNAHVLVSCHSVDTLDLFFPLLKPPGYLITTSEHLEPKFSRVMTKTSGWHVWHPVETSGSPNTNEWIW